MILRKIGRNRTSRVVFLPPSMLKEIGWKVGDYIGIDLIGRDILTLRRVQENNLTDAEILSAKEETIIEHD